MTASNVILSIRSRLRDEDRLRLRFSDEELRANLEMAQNALILEFDNNILHFTFEALKPPFHFTKRVLGIAKVCLNGKEIPNKPLSYALQNTGLFFSLSSHNSGILSKQAEGKLEVFANCAVRIVDLSDEMFLDEMFFNALVLGVLKQMILIETGQDNLQKVAPYEAFYRQEVARLYVLCNKSQTSKIHRTKWIKC